MAGQKAFTLLELVVVIMIAGILAMLTIPSYQRMMNHARLSGATRELVADLLRTRMECVAENRQFQFQFASDRYTISRDDDRNGTFETGEVRNTRDVASAYTGVTVAASRPITFSTKGMVTADTVTVSNCAETRRVLTNMVGRVRVE